MGRLDYLHYLHSQEHEDYIGEIERVNGGYSFQNFGFGRLFLMIAVQQILAKDPTRPENKDFDLIGDDKNSIHRIRFLRKELENRRRRDFIDCTIPALEELLLGYGGTLNEKSRQVFQDFLVKRTFDISDNPFFVRSEIELMRRIAKSTQLGPFKKEMDTEAVSLYIASGREQPIPGLHDSPIRVIYVPNEKLGEFISGDGVIERMNINSLIFKIKMYESADLKQADRIRRMFDPTFSENLELSRDEDQIVDGRVLIYPFQMWLRDFFASGLDYIEALHGEFNPLDYIRSRKEFKNINLDYFDSKVIFERFGDPFILDGAGFGLVVNGPTSNISGRFNHSGERYSRIPHKTEGIGGKRLKDGAAVWGIRGKLADSGNLWEFSDSLFSEVRVRNVRDLLFSTFGNYPMVGHYRYSGETSSKLTESLHRGTREVVDSYNNTRRVTQVSGYSQSSSF